MYCSVIFLGVEEEFCLSPLCSSSLLQAWPFRKFGAKKKKKENLVLWYSFPGHPTGRRLLSNLSVQSKNNWSGGRTFDSTSWGCICSGFVVLGIEPMVSNMLGKSSVTVSSLFHSSSFPSSFLIKARFLVKLAMLPFNSLSILCMCWILNPFPHSS